ncbi:MAG: ABC transporter ATP-binding protein [Chloroflexi bacterium]|jgi:peptide/nickel transport system ATP-binding protein|nr:ABC transporter ATP-binding protein [Chloroflexota bacterium]MBT7082523.1 ABC transporter ATP-binding protein [Chloroflexota bacterium]MBT7289612.1 ABC transporter ATP-binding protein [Chloroflexota bacterium]
MDNLFSATNLSKTFQLRKRSRGLGSHRFVKAVDGISFDVKLGETFGIVGESGCGKTTTARLIMQLEKATGGQMLFKDTDMTNLNSRATKKMRRHVQMIFQDPYTALNPVKTIFYLVAEPLKIHKVYKNKNELMEKVRETLNAVGLPSTDDLLAKRPDALSGGERQRVGIAKALVLDPEFVVADEPVSMLDASVRAEIVNLMLKLKAQRDLTYVFITHEFDVAYAICDRVAIMYAGSIIELGNTEDIIHDPLHPYTRLLLDAVPPLRPDKNWGNNIAKGEVAYYIAQPSGCKYQLRCDKRTDACSGDTPVLIEKSPGHYVACHLD